MKLRRLLVILMLGFLILLFSACTQVEEITNTLKTAKIMADRKAQFAITLNENLEWDLIGTRAGILIEDVKPCDDAEHKDHDVLHMEKSTKSSASKEEGLGDIFFQETFTVTVREGSCCVRVSVGSRTKKYCAPPYPLGFINMQNGNACTGTQ